MQPIRNKGSLLLTGFALVLAVKFLGAGPAVAQEQDAGAQPVLRIEGTADDLRRMGYLQETSARSDALNDPPGVVTFENLLSLRTLAAEISRNDSWLTEEAVRALDVRHLALGELFSQTSSLVSIAGKPYRIIIEKVGSGWERYHPGDSFVLYLTHEVFDGYGPEVALGYLQGTELLLTATDISTAPAIAITLEESEPIAHDVVVRSITDPITLGPLRPAGALARIGNVETASTPSMTCSPQFAPSACSGNIPVCPSGSSPYFVLSSLMIKTDHEGTFKGNPEIELFPLRLDSVSSSGGMDEATTDWLFSGRYVTDLAGQSRYLPNVQNNYVWYTINNGLALFPSDRGLEWSATLVEQDDDAGRLKVKPTKINVTKLFKRVSQVVNDIREMQYFHLVRSVFKLLFDIIKIFNDGDDIYQESIGISNELFCHEGLGQPFPRTFHLESQEWALQGYFACVNPSCVPPPPPPPPDDGCGWGPHVCP